MHRKHKNNSQKNWLPASINSMNEESTTLLHCSTSHAELPRFVWKSRRISSRICSNKAQLMRVMDEQWFVVVHLIHHFNYNLFKNGAVCTKVARIFLITKKRSQPLLLTLVEFQEHTTTVCTRLIELLTYFDFSLRLMIGTLGQSFQQQQKKHKNHSADINTVKTATNYKEFYRITTNLQIWQMV